ncbi:M24 family metallopeptidase [Arenimonas sp.]|uniref:M24 family metallopeptidase n=1 Tax=Arenimonas sp. TaxID=1872635 RepID=UPI0039E21EBE
MSLLAERLNHPVSTAELERRWLAVRQRMRDEKIDVLLMQNNNDFMGGYVKWFSDLSATNGYPLTVVFPREAGMTLVMQAPIGMDRKIPPGDLDLRGVERVLGVASYASAGYSLGYDNAAVTQALQAYVGGTIGLVGLGTLPVSMLDHLRRQFTRARFVDASELVDQIKVIKSDEEIALIRRCASMQDACMDAVFKAIRPGMRDIEAAAVAEQVSHQFGSEQGLYLCASTPVGQPGPFGPRRYQNRIIREGDYFAILVENSGPGAQYCELGRTCVLGKASDAMKEEMDFVVRAQQFTVNLLKPGAACADIWHAYNQFMRDNGRPPEERLYCHGQGYDMVERPLVRFDETMTIAAGMNLSCHPTYANATGFHWCCDNVLVGPQGGELIHQAPRRLIELG